MSRRKFTAEQIIGHLRTVEVLMGRGKTAKEACREVPIPSKLTKVSARNMAACKVLKLEN